MIDVLFNLVSEFWPYIAGALVVITAYFKGASDTKNKAKVEDLEGAIDVHKRVDQALRDLDGDTRPVDDRLRKHGRLRDD